MFRCCDKAKSTAEDRRVARCGKGGCIRRARGGGGSDTRPDPEMHLSHSVQWPYPRSSVHQTCHKMTKRRGDFFRWHCAPPLLLEWPYTAGGGGGTPPPSPRPLCVTFRWAAISLRGPGQSPVLPFACCYVLTAAAACVPCGVVFALAGPSSWRSGGCAGCCGGRFTFFAAHSPPHSGCPPLASRCFRGHMVRRVAVSSQGPGQSPVLPFACCVGSLCSDGRCGPCSCWCRCRVSGAQ